jgi:hypothetical protein
MAPQQQNGIGAKIVASKYKIVNEMNLGIDIIKNQTEWPP